MTAVVTQLIKLCRDCKFFIPEYSYNHCGNPEFYAPKLEIDYLFGVHEHKKEIKKEYKHLCSHIKEQIDARKSRLDKKACGHEARGFISIDTLLNKGD